MSTTATWRCDRCGWSMSANYRCPGFAMRDIFGGNFGLDLCYLCTLDGFPALSDDQRAQITNAVDQWRQSFPELIDNYINYHKTFRERMSESE